MGKKAQEVKEKNVYKFGKRRYTRKTVSILEIKSRKPIYIHTRRVPSVLKTE